MIESEPGIYGWTNLRIDELRLSMPPVPEINPSIRQFSQSIQMFRHPRR
jgi:hypothetical protein